MKKNILTVICALFCVAAFAMDENVPTSKSYVDAAVETKQDIIPAADGAVRVLTNTGVAGEYEPRGIYDAAGEYATQKQNLVDAQTMNAAVQNAIDSEFQCVEWVDPNDRTSDCLLMDIRVKTENVSPNLFDISKITTGQYSGARIVNNGDGSIVVTSVTNGAIATNKKLSVLVPEMIAGETYTLSFDTTGNNKSILLYCSGNGNQFWASNTSKLITANLLDCTVYFYASGVGTSATISNIQIERGTTATPYAPYGNIYVPSDGF